MAGRKKVVHGRNVGLTEWLETVADQQYVKNAFNRAAQERESGELYDLSQVDMAGYWCCKADFGKHEPECPNACPDCLGSGGEWYDEDEFVPCSRCHGTGSKYSTL